MKKILTIITSILLISNISYSKDNPLKIFKKDDYVDIHFPKESAQVID